MFTTVAEIAPARAANPALSQYSLSNAFRGRTFVAELSGLEVLALLKEIGSTLRGTYVNNIFTSGSAQLLRLRKQDQADLWLVASPKRGVWISGKVSERAETSEFTSRLRGELERARFVGASQVDLDRVFVLEFEGGGKKSLVVELMPPGNIIVVGADGRVVVTLEEVRSKARRVVRGEPYQAPKQTRASPLEIDGSSIGRLLSTEKTAGRAIGRNVALPRKYVAETLARMGLKDGSPSGALSGREEEVASTMRGLVQETRDSPSPCVCETDAGEEVYAIRPRGLAVTRSAGTLSELCDLLFLEEATSEERVQSKEEGRRAELEATIARLNEESRTLLVKAEEARSKAGAAASGAVEEGLNALRGSWRHVAKEPSSPASIASALYDVAKGLERRSAESLEAAKRLEGKLGKAAPRERKATKPLPRRKQEWYEKFRWFLTSEGRLAVGGRDAQSNTLLVRRHLEEGDVVYHADLFGSPFFVLKDGRRQTEAETLELAQATVSFSSGWKTGLGAADAYWVLRDQVSSSAGSGEYLAKGSFVVRGTKTFVRHALVQVALGLDRAGRVMAGPETAVAKACQRYVVLTPHREKASDTAKKVLKELGPQEEGAQGPTLDEVLRALPAGGGKVVRRRSRQDPSG